MMNTGRIIRTVATVGIIGFLLMLVIYNASVKPPAADSAWDTRATLGNLDAKRHYVFYTDIMCPYCDAFSRQVMANEDEFMDFLEQNDILYEIRLTDFLYEFGEHQSEYSRQSAEAAYCAKEQNKFWEYYDAALMALWEDYHSQGVGVSKTSPAITDMDETYWLELGHALDLGEEFDNCYNNHEKLAELEANTAKAAQIVDGGLPYFQFGKFTNSGFDQSWDWSYVKQYLEAGLK